jgi:protein-L-isoaspartate(D-aspartate) O-methyltransferase
VPQPLVDQLKEGGRMVIPVGPRLAQELYVIHKQNGQMRQAAIIDVRFVPMTRDAVRGDADTVRSEK